MENRLNVSIIGLDWKFMEILRILLRQDDNYNGISMMAPKDPEFNLDRWLGLVKPNDDVIIICLEQISDEMISEVQAKRKDIHPKQIIIAEIFDQQPDAQPILRLPDQNTKISRSRFTPPPKVNRHQIYPEFLGPISNRHSQQLMKKAKKPRKKS